MFLFAIPFTGCIIAVIGIINPDNYGLANFKIDVRKMTFEPDSLYILAQHFSIGNFYFANFAAKSKFHKISNNFGHRIHNGIF